MKFWLRIIALESSQTTLTFIVVVVIVVVAVVVYHPGIPLTLQNSFFFLIFFLDIWSVLGEMKGKTRNLSRRVKQQTGKKIERVSLRSRVSAGCQKSQISVGTLSEAADMTSSKNQAKLKKPSGKDNHRIWTALPLHYPCNTLAQPLCYPCITLLILSRNPCATLAML